jgi:putative ABC transport system permease protein
VDQGRFFSEQESNQGQRVLVLGSDVKEALFPSSSPLGRRVVIDNQPFLVVGTLKKQGDFFGAFSMDRRVVVPELASRKLAGGTTKRTSSSRNAPRPARRRPTARSRTSRGACGACCPRRRTNFEINRTEMIEQQVGPVKQYISLAGLFITGMALAVGAVGIMTSRSCRCASARARSGRGAPWAPRGVPFSSSSDGGGLDLLVGGVIGLG